MFRLEYTKNAARDIRRLDQQVAKRILKKMDFFSKQADPLKFAKKLKDSTLGDYRFRIGDYRVLFDVDEDGSLKILMVLSVKPKMEPPVGVEPTTYGLQIRCSTN